MSRPISHVHLSPVAEQLGFVTPIYHVNISEQGVACLPVLKVRSSQA
jgi:ubiquitin-protein ligase